METPTDATYIERVLAGDLPAYRDLVERYQNMAYTLALGVLKNETEAEDAAQEGFIQAYQQLRKFRGESSFSTWLYTIVYRCALHRQKREGRYLPLPEETRSVPDPAMDPAAVLSEAERNHYLRRAIALLPEIEATVVTLYYLDENPVATVATITGLSAGNVKIKLYRARKKLNHLLTPVIHQL